MNQRMEWKNLLAERCPKCGAAIYAENERVNCSAISDGCDFFITQKRLIIQRRLKELKSTMNLNDYDPSAEQ